MAATDLRRKVWAAFASVARGDPVTITYRAKPQRGWSRWIRVRRSKARTDASRRPRSRTGIASTAKRSDNHCAILGES